MVRWSGMKIRFGVGLARGMETAGLPGVIEALETAGIDSLWFSELVYGPQVDPVVGMAYTLARSRRLKVGTGVAILPGRNPVLAAKQLASLAALGPRRVLPVFGLAPANPAERALFPIERGRRGAAFDEALTLLRAALEQTSVDFQGQFSSVAAATISPRPEPPLDIWIGGSAPEALRRAGRLADGWLGSFLSPGEAVRARVAIQAAAAEAGRDIEADHFGISLTVGAGTIPPELVAAARRRRPGTEPGDMIAADWPALHRLLDGYIDGGLSKFVIRPSGSLSLERFLEGFVRELLPRQN